jgi:hypothetical protein
MNGAKQGQARRTEYIHVRLDLRNQEQRGDGNFAAAHAERRRWPHPKRAILPPDGDRRVFGLGGRLFVIDAQRRSLLRLMSIAAA